MCVRNFVLFTGKWVSTPETAPICSVTVTPPPIKSRRSQRAGVQQSSSRSVSLSAKENDDDDRNYDRSDRRRNEAATGDLSFVINELESSRTNKKQSRQSSIKLRLISDTFFFPDTLSRFTFFSTLSLFLWLFRVSFVLQVSQFRRWNRRCWKHSACTGVDCS